MELDQDHPFSNLVLYCNSLRSIVYKKQIVYQQFHVIHFHELSLSDNVLTVINVLVPRDPVFTFECSLEEKRREMRL